MSTKMDYLHWHEKVLEMFRNVFQRVLGKYSRFGELEDFSKEENRMYDADGNKTEGYTRALEAFNDYLESNQTDHLSIQSDDSPSLQESLATANAMIEERQRLMRVYEKDQNDQDPDTPFDAMEWMKNKIPEDAMDAARQRVKTELGSDINSTLEDYGNDNQ